MQLPYFYITPEKASQEMIELDEDSSRHIAQVLRMKPGASLHLTDGMGQFMTARILDAHKKHCKVGVEERSQKEPRKKQITIGISLVKNASRLEWFLEKSTEMGVAEIIPLLCQRTEKQKFRMDRVRGICVSAMLQSQQVWLPLLHEPRAFEELLPALSMPQKFIGYCDRWFAKKELTSYSPFNIASILIGPEGDFTSNEVDLALHHKIIPVSLGENRLRTETAGVVAAALMMAGIGDQVPMRS